jgi:SAM-dependent methyltransferase
VIAADATAVPLEDGCADVVLSFTMLHHLPDGAAQDRLLREAHRLLRPGGVFAGSDSRPSLLFTLAHVADTCTLVPPQTFDGRLVAAGFTGPEVDAVPHAFRFRAAA